MTKHLSLAQWLIMVGIILSGLFLFPNLFATTFLSKLLIVIGLSLTMIGAIAVRSIVSNKWVMVVTPVTGALLALAITTAASILFTQPYPVAVFGLGLFGQP
jgi:hypothetical protein